MNKLMRRMPASVLLLVGLCSVSCGGLPKTYYFTLQVPPPPGSSDPKTGFVVGVERFSAPQMLRDDRIVYYESPTQLNYYQYHRWSADPPSMLSELTARQLNALGVFAEVRLLPSAGSVDYALRGRVLNFEEVDYESGGKARVALNLTLVRSRDRKVVWAASRQAEHPIEQKGVEGVVEALNAATAQILGDTLPSLTLQIEREAQESSSHPQ